MISSPPEEAEHIRGKTLTPESPKPVHYPSPSNIPILEKQMDPMFDEPALSLGTPASFQSYPPPTQTHTPSAHSNTSHYAEQHAAPSYQNMVAHGSVSATPASYAQPAGQTQDTSSIQKFLSLRPPPTPLSESKSAPAQDSQPAYPHSHDSNLYAAQPSPAQIAQGLQFQPQASGIDYHALLASLSPAVSGAASDRYAAPSFLPPALSQGATPASSLPAAPNLPPRPPAQEKPTTHPNYNPNDDIRSYHPHSNKSTSSQHHVGSLQPLNVRVPGNGDDSYSASRSNQSPNTPGGYGRQMSEDYDDEDIRWPPEVNRLYEEFLDDERRYVTDGQWDQFPMGSRLFIGNLPTEKVTKRDIFHRFYRHGKLAQISIKQAYGFVQFLDISSCQRALQAEQGQAVRGRKMHLEVSKPQRNTKKAPESNTNDKTNGARRRSRSPDYTRGGSGTQSRNDRYSSGSQSMLSPRDKDNRRFRDDYRRMRSPTPPRGNRGRERSRDRYDRRRSRSRSPIRYRSPSPQQSPTDDLPLPHRAPHQVPDVQVLVVHEGLPRDYIRWVEDIFRQQNLRTDVLILSPRLAEDAVVRRQIVEGVQAIVRLDTSTLAKSKVNVQVFDRRGGANNVQFNEYADLDPSTAAALVNNAKQSQSQPVQPPAPQLQSYGQSYGIPSYSSTQPPAPTNAPNLSNFISSLDANGLSQLLGVMSGTAAQPSQPPSTGLTPDLARLLGSVSAPTQAPTYTPVAQVPQIYPNSYQNQALASLLNAQQPMHATAPPTQAPAQVTPTGQPDMNEIMAQLAKYQR
ncbi:hypothetical protein BDV95DRAFT_628898 [Massariosphaeria phaeospora]|uniref:RRM domain-containing protein n=1 Tax=Massariosphaeria phaeospora TaxID=100035 RepID=A0A7C8I747_9PLEO|nr:hypothetical protein BDV95DRAFT_628898 [Massariosphaeria phaeospora]